MDFQVQTLTLNVCEYFQMDQVNHVVIIEPFDRLDISEDQKILDKFLYT